MLRRSVLPVIRAVVGASVAAAAVLVLAGCVGGPDPAPTSSAPSPSATDAPVEVAFVPDGSAEDNLPIFTQTAQGVWDSEQRGEGRAYIDALVGVGFDKAAMQVTNDQSTVGNAAESLQFSVRWGDTECLIGQVGPSTGQLVTQVMPQLAEGRCLIGTTRAIDW
ncbi:DUF6993 domain-containing protein [Microbacterium galbinum]|uniref:DUF6993 domain-containing protein n=1 Tax=Microbacterium galbinum TaxID=2851646 RepID=UPI002000933D|nr:hypothetical protein [Microbacterium galbinum]